MIAEGNLRIMREDRRELVEACMHSDRNVPGH
jgi:hypothetical protein